MSKFLMILIFCDRPCVGQDDFFFLGGDSLAGLAVTKRLLEWDGESRWPDDGVVDGPLALCYLQQYSTLQDYVNHLEQSGIGDLWRRKGASSEYRKIDHSDSEHDSPRNHVSRRNGSSETKIEAESSLTKRLDDLPDSVISSVRKLRAAAANGDLVTVLNLLAASADPNGCLRASPDKIEDAVFTGVPPLHAAANQGHHEVRILSLLFEMDEKCSQNAACTHFSAAALSFSYPAQQLFPCARGGAAGGGGAARRRRPPQRQDVLLPAHPGALRGPRRLRHGARAAPRRRRRPPLPRQEPAHGEPPPPPAPPA